MNCATLRSLGGAWAVAAGVVLAAPAHAQDAAAAYPSKPVRLVVPSAPGGGTDIIGRIIAQAVSDGWGQTVVVDNRGGGGGTVGMAIVARASPDGHTMGLGSVGHLTFSPIVRPGLPYDAQKDLEPISLAAVQPFLMAVSPNLPAKSIKEFIALAKSRPSQIKYGSGGIGAASHVGIALLEMDAGLKLQHISYKGSNPALTAVMGGEIDMALAGLATILPHAKSGRVRALAVTGSKRAQIAPDIPTVAESGVPGYAFDVWYGLVFTGGTPSAIVEKANTEVRKRLTSPEVHQRFLKVGIEPLTSTSAEFKSRIATEIAKWRKVVKAANIKVQ